MRYFAELLGWMFMVCSAVLAIAATTELAMNFMWKKIKDAHAMTELMAAVREYQAKKGGSK